MMLVSQTTTSGPIYRFIMKACHFISKRILKRLRGPGYIKYIKNNLKCGIITVNSNCPQFPILIKRNSKVHLHQKHRTQGAQGLILWGLWTL